MNRFWMMAFCLAFSSGCSALPPPIPTATIVPFTATAIATSTSTITSAPTATTTNTPTPIPTTTPSPTPTSTPTSTPTATATLTSTPAPTKTFTPTPTPAPRYPPITLREPPDNQKRETVAITFQWEDLVFNQDGDHYQVYVRHATSPTWEKTFDAGRQRQIVWGREQNIGYGDFVWTVFVIDTQGNIVSDKGVERKFYWCHPRSGCQECSSCHR